MQPFRTAQPAVRSPLRMAAGRSYFRAKRWVTWHFSPTTWAKRTDYAAAIAQTAVRHQSPLLRELLHLSLTETDLVGEWRTTERLRHRYAVYEAWHQFRPEFWGGYSRHNQLRRRVFDEDGEQIADEFITENHAITMYAPLLV